MEEHVVQAAGAPVDPTERVELLLRDLRTRREGLSSREAERRILEVGHHATAACPRVAKVLAGMADGFVDRDGHDQAITSALVGCDCAVDPGIVRSILWRLEGDPAPTEELKLELARDAPAIRAPGATPWSEASKLLSAKTGRAWLVAD